MAIASLVVVSFLLSLLQLCVPMHVLNIEYVIHFTNTNTFRVLNAYITGLYCGKDAESWIAKYLGYDGPSIVVSTPSMVKRDSSLVVKKFGNPAVEGDLVYIFVIAYICNLRTN